MMKNIVIVALLLGLTGQVSADNKKVWKGVFVGSAVVMVGGLFSFVHGKSEISDSKQALCDGGAYSHIDPSCPQMTTLTPAQLNALNDQGDRGKQFVYLGYGGVLVGGALATYSFYKGFIEKDKAEPKVVVAPTLIRGGAGAALSIRW